MRHFVLLGLIAVSALLVLSAGTAAADHHEADAAADSGSGAPDARSMLEQELDKIPSGKEGEKQIFDSLNERLSLTPEQQEKVKPIIAETVASMEQARDSFKSGEISAMAMMMTVQLVGRKSAEQIEPLLDEKQKVEYQAMRTEQQQAMAQEMMKRRAAMGGGM